MSTYAESPYILANIEAPADNSCANIHSFVTKIRNAFIEGGWDVENVGPRLILTTEDNPGFSFCTLGHSNVSFYTVSLGGSSYAIVDEPDDCDACNNVTVDLIVQTYDNISQRHEYIKAVISALYSSVEGVTVYPTSSTLVGTDLVSELIVDSISSCLSEVSIGSQLVSNLSEIEGAGFIARSQDSIESGNRVELYCTYLGSGGATSFVRIYYRIGGWPSRNFTPGTETSVSIYCPNPDTIAYIPATVTGDHPWQIVQDELGTTVQQADFALNGQDIEIWINSYTAIWDPADARVGDSAGGFASALKLKALEGEASLNITKAVIFVARVGGGQSLREECLLESTRVALEFQGNGFSTVEVVSNATTGNWGPLVLCVLAETIDYEDHADGVVWNGGIAEVGEPWCAINFLNSGTTELAAVVAQLWDCIIPYRNINLGYNTQSSQTPFYWDGKLWRYYQIDKEGSSNTGPPSSLAFRVADCRIYDGNDYTGQVPATVVSVSCSPNPIPNGDSAVIIVAIESAPSVGAFVVLQTRGDERMQFASQLIFFTEGQTSQNVNVTTIGLEIEETVTLSAIGTNTVTESVTYSAS